MVDGVECYKGCLVVPMALRQQAYESIHAAPRGMNNRVDQALFWPGMSMDIINLCHECGTCIREALSQPASISSIPVSAVGDYFSLQENNYLVLSDRYSVRLSVHEAG